MRLAPIALISILAPLAATAQVAGTITGTIEGEDAVWQIPSEGDVPLSFFEQSEDGYAVTIRGYPNSEPEDESGMIEISFFASGTIQEPEVRSPRVTVSGGDPVLEATDENVDLILEAFEVEDTDLAIAGSLVTTLTPGGADTLVIDAPEAVTIDGNFQGTIPRAE